MNPQNIGGPQPQSNFGSDVQPPVPSPAINVPVTTTTFNSAPVNQPPTPTPETVPAIAHSFNDISNKSDSSGDAAITFGTADASGAAASDSPVPVVRVLSVRGVEYGMMTITLWIAAAALAGGLISVINGANSFSILAFPISLLLVCVPVFAFFFLRLKKAELAKPELRQEPSKRRWSQITQFLAFITLLINLVVFVYMIMASIGGDSQVSWGKAFGDLAVIMVVAGGILAYYWVDEHRQLNH